MPLAACFGWPPLGHTHCVNIKPARTVPCRSAVKEHGIEILGRGISMTMTAGDMDAITPFSAIAAHTCSALHLEQPVFIGIRW